MRSCASTSQVTTETMGSAVCVSWLFAIEGKETQMLRQRLITLWVLLFAGTVLAAPTEESTAEPVEEQEAPTEGLLPVPEYAGGLGERAWLLGDLGGVRTDLANYGLQFDIQWTQAFQSIVDGGRDRTGQYGGSLDYNLKLDLQKLGLLPGALISVGAESRYGNTVNSQSGLLLPVNVDGFFPLSSDDNIEIALTSLNYTQFLSPHFGVVAGKVTTLDGDLNEFASGRGVRQFQNAAFLFSPVAGLTVPYSSLAVGAIWLPTPKVQLSTTVLNASDSSTTSGFDDFGAGWFWSTELSFQYLLGNKPGGQTFGGALIGDADFARLGHLFTFDPGEGVATSTTDESWYLSWNFWQYITTESTPEGPIQLRDGTPDLQGLGIFGRAGIADDNTNPVDWSASIGLAGRGLIPRRDNDVLGVGYFYTHLQSSRIQGTLGIDDQTQGGEMFYSIALTPAVALTPNCQVAEGAVKSTDTAVILGLRLHLQF